jgi:hypothetical protein
MSGTQQNALARAEPPILTIRGKKVILDAD